MSNAQHSRTHGLTKASVMRPKSKLRVRRNKAKANARKAVRRSLKKA